MTAPSDTLQTILGEHNVEIIEWAEDHAAVISRADTTRLLAGRYDELRFLRTRILSHDANRRPEAPDAGVAEAAQGLAEVLRKRRMLRKTSPLSQGTASGTAAYEVADDHTLYLAGGWLEELTWLAFRAAGADEVWRGVKVCWKAGGEWGKNEIDVVARRGREISFASCKAVEGFPTIGSTTKLTAFLNELIVWDQHFSGGLARVMLVVTTDLIDELNGNAHRLPSLLGRSRLFDVTLLGRESLGWASFVDAVRRHWK